MKGRRALPTAEALTGQKPRQRLTSTAIIKLLRNGKHLTQRTASLIKTEGEIGVPCVAASCACLGVRKAITSADENKMLSSFVVRFCFHRRPCATPPLPSSVPRHSLRCAPLARLQTSVFGSKASRFRGSLLARGFLGRPRDPLSGASERPHLFVGCSRAPLVLRPCWVARPAVPLSER